MLRNSSRTHLRLAVLMLAAAFASAMLGSDLMPFVELDAAFAQHLRT